MNAIEFKQKLFKHFIELDQNFNENRYEVVNMYNKSFIGTVREACFSADENITYEEYIILKEDKNINNSTNTKIWLSMITSFHYLGMGNERYCSYCLDHL